MKVTEIILVSENWKGTETNFLMTVADYLKYVDMDTFQDGDVILKPDSQSVYEIKEKKALEGVYCINKGYAVFRKIVMIEQNDEYCIVETGTTYGLSQFDYIVRNGNTVKEDDILFK